MRLRLNPGLPRAWRDARTLQIGLSPGPGTVLTGLTAADRTVLDRLATGLDPDELGSGRRDGGVPARARALLALLAEGGVLVRAAGDGAALARLGAGARRLAPDAAAWSLTHADAEDGWGLLAARASRRVEVHGTGRTSRALVRALRAAGVGEVSEVSRVGEAGEGDGAEAAPAVVVRVERDVADSLAAAPLVASGGAHLSVVVAAGTTVVGPLVVPGATPCLRCLDLHRADRDPAWPRVLAQLLAARRSGPPGPPGPSGPSCPSGDDDIDGAEESALAGIAAGVAALQVLARLDGRTVPAACGATLEVSLPHGLVARRPWPAHPACGCTWPPARGRNPGQDGRGGGAPGRMAR